MRVAVVGGGPAGLMAAEVAAIKGHEVTLYDAMPSVGRKLLVAGRGGLNLTHSEPLSDLLGRYPGSPPQLVDAIRSFTPTDLIEWCGQLGQSTFVGTSGRIFPATMRATPLLRAWLRRLDRQGVRLEANHRWTGWVDGGLQFETTAGSTSVQPDATVLALGGASWPRTGSTGTWATALRDVGVTVNELRATNCGVSVGWSDVFTQRHVGDPVKSVAVSHAGRTVRGELIVTSSGLEGGPVYALSRSLREALDHATPTTLEIDLRADLPVDDLAMRLSRPRAGRTLTAHLRKAAGLPAVAIGLLRESSGGPLPHDSGALASRIKHAAISVDGMASIGRAISSAGGVAFDAIDDRFMLRARPGVFVAGEMLDWEAPTGGYLLQACFATGVAAGNGLCRWLAQTRAT